MQVKDTATHSLPLDNVSCMLTCFQPRFVLRGVDNLNGNSSERVSSNDVESGAVFETSGAFGLYAKKR